MIAAISVRVRSASSVLPRRSMSFFSSTTAVQTVVNLAVQDRDTPRSRKTAFSSCSGHCRLERPVLVRHLALWCRSKRNEPSMRCVSRLQAFTLHFVLTYQSIPACSSCHDAVSSADFAAASPSLNVGSILSASLRHSAASQEQKSSTLTCSVVRNL